MHIETEREGVLLFLFFFSVFLQIMFLEQCSVEYGFQQRGLFSEKNIKITSLYIQVFSCLININYFQCFYGMLPRAWETCVSYKPDGQDMNVRM